MIQEAYCSFEVSKLLDEKGFDEKCSRWYVANEPQEGIVEKGFGENQFYINAPTHQMAMAWLREIHNIDIIIFHEKLPNNCYWARIERHPFTEFQQEPEYKTYEKAVDDALKYVLENLI